MKILFELIKGIFLFMTVGIGIFFSRGEILLTPTSYTILKQFLVPGYLLFCGLMIGYIISLSYKQQDTERTHHLYSKFFMIGLVIGLLLAIAYIIL